MVSQTPSRAPADGRFEAHQKYIDIHYLISGAENIGIAPVGELESATPYDAATDVEFFEPPARYDERALQPGQFLVCFPGQGRLPLCHLNGPHEILKVVVKVSVEYWQTRKQ